MKIHKLNCFKIFLMFLIQSLILFIYLLINLITYIYLQQNKIKKKNYLSKFEQNNFKRKKKS